MPIIIIYPKLITTDNPFMILYFTGSKSTIISHWVSNKVYNNKRGSRIDHCFEQ